MKLLLDHGTPRSSASIFRELGLDAVHTGEIGLAEAEDEEVLRHAALEDRVVVTLNADFHAILALTQSLKPSVIRIRMEGLRAEPFCGLIQNVLDKCADDLERGAMVSVNDFQIRIRHLQTS